MIQNGQAQPHAERTRPLRVLLLTDTLADVNGVSRFIMDMLHAAEHRGLDLTVATSTRMVCPPHPRIINFRPRLASRMPKYETLEIVTPPFRRVSALVAEMRPDVVHISTPGPVGLAGFRAARRFKIPIVGVYHTDFPAYIDHLLEDQALTWAANRFMRWFYGPFMRIFTRSAEYANSLVELGLPCSRIKRLRPGTDSDTFHPRFADPTIWEKFPDVRRDAVKVIYVGRVSVEKNMPLLARVWPNVLKRLAGRDLMADLVLVGDGPYRQRMQAEWSQHGQEGTHAHFLGFRYGQELSTLYASSDLFVFPSVTDTLGQVVLESQASCLPAIVTNVGGPKEVVRHNRTGMILDPARPSEWIDAIVDLVADNERRRTMGLAARGLAEAHSIAASFEHFWSVHESAHHEHQARLGLVSETPEDRARRERLEEFACA